MSWALKNVSSHILLMVVSGNNPLYKTSAGDIFRDNFCSSRPTNTTKTTLKIADAAIAICLRRLEVGDAFEALKSIEASSSDNKHALS